MTATVTSKRSWPKRLLWATLALVVILAVVLLALRIFITTAAGARFIEGQVNKRSFGPVESITISGFSGDPLKAISIENITIRDKDGVWLRMRDFDLTWKPFAFLGDHLWIETLTIEETSVLRKPVLNPTESTGPSPKITLENFDFEAIDLNEDFLGQALRLESSGQFVAETNGAVSANLKAARLDVQGDAVALDFNRSSAGEMIGDFEIEGAADGAIAALLKSPGAVSGRGKLNGDETRGDGTLVITFGDDQVINAQTTWTPATLNADATLTLDDWPALDAVKQRLGSSLKSRLVLNRQAVPQRFAANLNVPGLSVDAAGALPESGGVPEAAQLNVVADDLSLFIPFPEGYAAKSGTAQGDVRLSAPFGFNGTLALAEIATPYGSAAQITGPLSASQSGENTYEFQTDLKLKDISSTTELPIALAAETKLTTTGAFNAEGGRLTLQNFSVTSGPNIVTAAGNLTTDGQSLDLRGTGTAAIQAQGNIPEGRLKAEYALRKNPKSLLAVTTDGAFRPTAPMADPLGGLIGEQLVFKANMSPIEQGLSISNISLIGERVRAAISGTLGEQLDLSGEATLSGPLALESVAIGGGADSSFKITGTRDAPTVRLDATAESVTLQDYVLENARVRTEITDVLTAPEGPVQIEANTAQGPLSASTQFESRPGIYIANDIDLTWGRLMAGGNLQYPQDGIATGQLDLRLPEKDGQFARAALTLSNVSGEQGLRVAADAEKIALAGFEIDTLSANIGGTLAALAGTIKADGQRGRDIMARRFEVETPVALTRGTDQTYTASLSPDARYGDIAITARAPITANYAAGDLTLNVPLSVADGTIDLLYQRGAERERLKLNAAGLPVTLIPMPGNLADTRGRISADVDLTAQGNMPVRGEAVVSIADWRGFDVKTGQGLTGDVRVGIDGARANAVLNVGAPSGFKADGQLRLPIVSTSSLAETRLDMNAPISGTFTASGAAASVLGLFTPSDAELGGTLSSNITISGTASSPRVNGQAAGQDIRFEAPELGTRIRRGRFTADFTNDSLTLRDLYLADTDDGSLTGSGAFKLGEFGRPLGKIDLRATRFRALDRRDVEAKVNGTLEFVSEAEDATLSGDIKINKAELKQFVTGNVSVVQIDVEEINRPDTVQTLEIKPPATPVNLNLRVRAPRRIYIRSRGMDVELSVDVTVKGTVTEPLFYGEAKVERGGYKIAGKTLNFENGNIQFDGSLADATINFKAVTETQNLDASVAITGTVEEPEITLSSTPERPQDEILSALLFGRSATELSTIEAAQLAGALAQLSGKGGGLDLLGGLRDAFGIGQLSVSFSPDGSAQLVGGRYLTKNVYLQVFSGAGPDQTGAIIDWEIRRNIALRSRIRADSDQSLSLKWKKDF